MLTDRTMFAICAFGLNTYVDFIMLHFRFRLCKPILAHVFILVCDYDGNSYAEGDSFNALDGCNTCQCIGGAVVCSNNPCGKDFYMHLR